MKFIFSNGSEIEGVKSVDAVRGTRSQHIKWETEEKCPNCDVNLVITKVPFINFSNGEEFDRYNLECGICSYGFSIDSDEV
jgi:hypothetical protein